MIIRACKNCCFTFWFLATCVSLSVIAGPSGTLSYIYDSVGNLQTIFSPYDFENRLIHAETPAGAVDFVNDGDGNRVAKTVNGVTTEFLVDGLNPTGYAQVLEEVEGGAVRAVYSYGLEMISQTRGSGASWATHYHGYDGHGSVRFLTDEAGAITDTYDYDAFGVLINRSGSTANDYLFTGEQYDPDVELYYNRARYLNTGTGRFWSMDTAEGYWEDPLSLHKYMYVANNPVNLVDPSGHDFDLGSTMMSVGIQAQLFATAHPLMNTVMTCVLLTLAPEDFTNSLPLLDPEVQFINAVQTEAKELRVIRRLLQQDWLEKFAAGRNFESWMINRVIANIPKDAVQKVVQEGLALEGQGRPKGSAVIDAIIKSIIMEFKTSFGAAGKYQAQQFAKYAQKAGMVWNMCF